VNLQIKANDLPVNHQKVPSHQEGFKAAHRIIEGQTCSVSQRPCQPHTGLFVFVCESNVQIFGRVTDGFLLLFFRCNSFRFFFGESLLVSFLAGFTFAFLGCKDCKYR